MSLEDVRMSEQLHACLDCDAWVTALSDANAGGALPPGTIAFPP